MKFFMQTSLEDNFVLMMDEDEKISHHVSKLEYMIFVSVGFYLLTPAVWNRIVRPIDLFHESLHLVAAHAHPFGKAVISMGIIYDYFFHENISLSLTKDCRKSIPSDFIIRSNAVPPSLQV